MVGTLQPLGKQHPVVNADGTPTEYFIRWAQQKQVDIGASVEASAVPAIIAAYLADHELQAGTGIGISPSGNVADTPTISAEVQAILDQISTTQGTILYRGAADWEALTPGTSGQFLKTMGAGANPQWATPTGGSAAWTLLSSWDFATNGAINYRDVSVAGYDEVMVILNAVSLSATQWRTLKFSTNGGVSWDTTAGNYVAIAPTGAVAVAGDVNLYMHSSSAAAARYCTAMLSNLSKAAPTVFNTNRESNFGLHTPSVVVNAIRIGTITDVPTFNGGSFFVYGR